MMKISPATDRAMALLLPLMKDGAMDTATAEEVLHDHHACALITLNRCGLVTYDDKTVKTMARWKADCAKAEKAKALKAQKKALRAELAKIEAELKALK